MKSSKTRIVILALIIGVILGIIFAINQILFLKKAHSTFENYYAFRGCVQLLQKTSTYGICKTNTGQTIKIVLYKGKWFLAGDLPTCAGGFCF